MYIQYHIFNTIKCSLLLWVLVDVYIVGDKIYDNLKVYQRMQNVFDDVSNLVLVHFPDGEIGIIINPNKPDNCNCSIANNQQLL